MLRHTRRLHAEVERDWKLARCWTQNVADPEATTPQVQRWLRALGYVCEGRLRRHAPDGSDVFVYGRVVA